MSKNQFDYINEVERLIERIIESQTDKMMAVAHMFVDNIRNDRIIHVFGTGHSQLTGMEVFARAGGLANINLILDSTMSLQNGARRAGAIEQLSGIAKIIFDQYKINAGDIMIITSNSGRNAMPIEMAQLAKDAGVYTIALTNLKQSEKIISRHSSAKRLFEMVDLVLDTCVPEGDSLMEVAGVKSAPGSSMATMIILNSIIIETLKTLAQDGEPLPVLQSQNLDGYDNDAIYAKYEDRIKHY